jgi:ribosomal protein S17E
MMSARPPDQVDVAAIERLAHQLFDRLRNHYVITIDLECNAHAVAAVLSVRPKTLRNWRDQGYGPTPSRTMHGVAWYRLSELAEWILHQGRGVLEGAQPANAGSRPGGVHR